jgi:hypothetical protein
MAVERPWRPIHDVAFPPFDANNRQILVSSFNASFIFTVRDLKTNPNGTLKAFWTRWTSWISKKQ